jgi:hypothetical protein
MIEIHEIITASNFFLLYYPTILKLMAWEYFIWFLLRSSEKLRMRFIFEYFEGNN